MCCVAASQVTSAAPGSQGMGGKGARMSHHDTDAVLFAHDQNEQASTSKAG